jgi:CheY-like chemotaxis protein
MNVVSVRAAAVLLVDDVPENLLVLEAVMAPLGLTTVRAATGNEALERARQRPYAVVVLDDRLPDMRGAEVARRLTAEHGDACPPILLHTSGDPTMVRQREWYAAGVLDVVQKPFDPEIFRCKMRIFVRLATRQVVS